MDVSDLIGIRLEVQNLSGPVPGTPADVVRRFGAVQSQDFAGAIWSLGARLENSTYAEAERAFNEGAILRTHMLRPTWHFVTPDDIRPFLRLTAPRVQAICAGMYRKLELDPETLVRGMNVLEAALRGGRELTRSELGAVLADNGFPAGSGQRTGYILMYCELEGMIVSGARREKQFTYALFDERVPPGRPFDRDEALRSLSERYLESRGPATVHDFARWSGLTVADARRGFEAAGERFLRETVDGREYLFPASVPVRSGDGPYAQFLSVYDEYISGYKDHDLAADPRLAVNLFTLGNALTGITVLDGMIVGVFKRVLGKNAVKVEAGLYVRPSDAERSALEAAAGRLGKFLGLPAVLNVTHAG